MKFMSLLCRLYSHARTLPARRGVLLVTLIQVVLISPAWATDAAVPFAGKPKIALYPLKVADGGQVPDAVVEMIDGVLLSAASADGNIEVLDRTSIDELFSEKQIALSQSGSNGRDSLQKLPPADYVISGAVSEHDGWVSFSLALARASTAEILFSERRMVDRSTVAESAKTVMGKLLRTDFSVFDASAADARQKVAIGPFIDDSGDSSGFDTGALLVNQLTADVLNPRQRAILQRQNMVPLAIEKYLLHLQFGAQQQALAKPVADVSICGVYRLNKAPGAKAISLFLYFDGADYGRSLSELHADSFPELESLASAEIENVLFRDFETATPESSVQARTYFDSAMGFAGIKPAMNLDAWMRGSFYQLLGVGKKFDDAKLDDIERNLAQAVRLDPREGCYRLALARIKAERGDYVGAKRQLVLLAFARNRDYSSGVDNLVGDIQRLASIEKMLAAQFAGNASLYGKLAAAKIVDGAGKVDVTGRQYQYYHRAHTLRVAEIDADVSTSIAEILRMQAVYPRNEVEVVTVPVSTDDTSHRKIALEQLAPIRQAGEAAMRYKLAESESGFWIDYGRNFSLPRAGFAEALSLKSGKRQDYGYDLAVDQAAASVYIEPSFTRAKLLLGRLLCHQSQQHCAVGNRINAWVLDEAEKARVGGSSGFYTDVKDEELRRDADRYLAADAIGIVDDVEFSELFTSIVLKRRHDVRRNKAAPPLPDVVNSQPADLATLEADLRATCRNLEKDPRALGRPTIMEPDNQSQIDQLVQYFVRNPDQLSQRKAIWQKLESDCPTSVAQLVIGTNSSEPFILAEQEEMIRQVAEGQVTVSMPRLFASRAALLFDQRVEQGKQASVSRFPGYIEKILQPGRDEAIEYAYLKFRNGDGNGAAELLKKFGRERFTLEKFSNLRLNGHYVQDGFNKLGNLVFRNQEQSGVTVYYRTRESLALGIGEKNLTWSFEVDGREYGGRNMRGSWSSADSFAGSGDSAGKRVWDQQPAAESHVDAPSVDMIELEPLYAKRAFFQPIKDDSLFALDRIGFQADGLQVIVGQYSYPAPGPLDDRDLRAHVDQSQDVAALKEKLFQLGYIDATGRLTLKPQDKLQSDFPEFTYPQYQSLLSAFNQVRNVQQAGVAQIYRQDGDKWTLDTRLYALDSAPDKRFGVAVALNGAQAAVCDYQKNLYFFDRMAKGWEQVQKLKLQCNCSCTSLSMSGNDLIAGGNARAGVYVRSGNTWSFVQQLQQDNYAALKEDHIDISEFGSAVKVFGDNAIVTSRTENQHHGIVYLYRRDGSGWKQIQKLTGDKYSFGESVEGRDDMLAVGVPQGTYQAKQEQHGGFVYLYKFENDRWNLVRKLTVKPDVTGFEFGSRVMFVGSTRRLMITSGKSIYQYDASSL
jgi:hypothetical protein